MGGDPHAGSERSAPDSNPFWHACRAAQGMPWRTKPESDARRQAFLAERRAATAGLALAEGVVGLLLKIGFTATFTNRFFGR